MRTTITSPTNRTITLVAPFLTGLSVINNGTPTAMLRFDAPSPAVPTTYVGKYQVDGSNAVNVTIQVAAVTTAANVPLWPHTDLRQPLTNDDMPPAGTIRYAEPGGSGTGGSTEGSAGDVQTTLTASGTGNTVVCLPGTYDVPAGLTIPSGVTLVAKFGTAAVISKCVEFSRFQTTSPGVNTKWIVFDAAKRIYQSVGTTFSPNDVRLTGVWMEDGAGGFRRPHYLFPYKSLADLQAPVGVDQSPGNYSGPGAYLHTDGRVYIRMQKPHPAKYSVDDKWRTYKNPYAYENPNMISGGRLNYPVSEDPRNYEIFIGRENNKASAFRPGSGCTIGSGINSVGYTQTIATSGWGTLKVRRGLHHATIGITQVNAALSGLYCNRMRWTCGGLRHLSVLDFKFLVEGHGYLDGIRPDAIVHVGSGTSQNFHFLNCTIQGGSDFWVGQPQQLWQTRFKYCTMFDTLEEGFQGRPATRFSVENCYFLACGMPTLGSSGGSTPNPPGQTYWHHNIWDMRHLQVYWYSDSPMPALPSLNHSQQVSYPKKAWNNTVLYGPDTVNQQTPAFGEQISNNTAVSTEIFNNIIVRMDDTRYDIGGPSVGGNDPSDRLQWLMRPESNAHWDYNMWWRSVPSATQGKWQAGGSSAPQYNTLAALFAATGFEQHGVEAQPKMAAVTDWVNNPRAYRPTNVGMSATTQPPSGETWDNTPPTWGVENFNWDTFVINAWNGALNPAGTTMPVGVQNP